MRVTLRVRLAAIATIVFGVTLVALGIGSYAVLARRLDADLTDRLVQMSEALHGYLRVDREGARVVYDTSDSDQAAFVHEATHYFQVYEVASGRLLLESEGLAPLGLQFTAGEVEALVARPAPIDLDTDLGPVRLVSSVKQAAADVPYLLQVGVPLAPLEGTLRRYRNLLGWSIPAALLFAAGACWWLSGLALQPLARVAAAAGRVDVTTLDQRLPVRGVGDELDHVAGAFNDTLGRLEHAVGEMRQFSGALAHELRTPLAALRGQIELSLRAPGTSPAARDLFGSQLEEVDRLTHLISRILMLARAESGQIHLVRAPVDLSGLAATLVDQLEPLAEARAITLRLETSSEAVVSEGDASWLERLLLNLLDNAIKYTNANGIVTVRVWQEGSVARVEVQDTGMGLSSEDAHRVFERFFRADPARSGSATGAGLGLSLVQWIAEQHHGTVSVHSRLGEGSTFTVTLPATPR